MSSSTSNEELKEKVSKLFDFILDEEEEEERDLISILKHEVVETKVKKKSKTMKTKIKAINSLTPSKKKSNKNLLKNKTI